VGRGGCREGVVTLRLDLLHTTGELGEIMEETAVQERGVGAGVGVGEKWGGKEESAVASQCGFNGLIKTQAVWGGYDE